MSTWHERKQWRKEYNKKFVYGWKSVTCTACSGSGRYDNTGSPMCGSCNGTGKEKQKPKEK